MQTPTTTTTTAACWCDHRGSTLPHSNVGQLGIWKKGGVEVDARYRIDKERIGGMDSAILPDYVNGEQKHHNKPATTYQYRR